MGLGYQVCNFGMQRHVGLGIVRSGKRGLCHQTLGRRGEWGLFSDEWSSFLMVDFIFPQEGVLSLG